MVSTGSTCGDNATSYYYEFEYEDQRVVIVNGIPDHDAENDQLVDNTNTRCERWQSCNEDLRRFLMSAMQSVLL